MSATPHPVGIPSLATSPIVSLCVDVIHDGRSCALSRAATKCPISPISHVLQPLSRIQNRSSQCCQRQVGETSVPKEQTFSGCHMSKRALILMP